MKQTIEENGKDIEDKMIGFLTNQHFEVKEISSQIFWLSESENSNKEKLNEIKQNVYTEVSNEVDEETGKKVFSNKELRDVETDRRLKLREDVNEIESNLQSIKEKKAEKYRELESLNLQGKNYRTILRYRGGIDES